MKKVFAVVLSLVLLMAASAMAETITLAHFGAPGEPVTSAAETFKAKLEELSGGAFTVDIQGNSALGNAKEMVE